MHDMKLRKLFPRTIVMDEGLSVVDGVTKDILADSRFVGAHGLEKL
jgi:ABC-type branched-subunit amino acid transport system ATPase component